MLISSQISENPVFCSYRPFGNRRPGSRSFRLQESSSSKRIWIYIQGFNEPLKKAVENSCWFCQIQKYRGSRRITLRWRWRAISSAKGLMTRWYNEGKKRYYSVAAISIRSQQGRERFASVVPGWMKIRAKSWDEIGWRKVLKRAHDEEPGSACDTRDKFNELPLGSSLKIRQKVLLLKEELRISNISKECENDSRPKVYFSQTVLCRRISLKYFLLFTQIHFISNFFLNLSGIKMSEFWILSIIIGCYLFTVLLFQLSKNVLCSFIEKYSNIS